MRKAVYVAVLNQGNIRVELNAVLSSISADPRYNVKVVYPALRPIQHNRNTVVFHFLESRADYLLMMDSDTVPRGNPLDLVVLDKDIVACPCPQWRKGDIFWVVMDRTEGGFRPVPPARRGGLVQADAVGTGCILIARRVLEAIAAPFAVQWTEDGRLDVGLDFAFCARAKQHGFEVWVAWNYPCSHYKTINLVDIIELVMRKRKKKE